MSETKRDYEIGYGQPPWGRPFQKSQSGNPRGPRPKSLPALLVGAPKEKVVATIDGERPEITKRQAVVTQLVNGSAGADLPAAEMPIDMDMLNDAEEGRHEKTRFKPGFDVSIDDAPLHATGHAGPGRDR